MFLGLIAIVVVFYFVYQAATRKESGLQDWFGNHQQVVHKAPQEIINERYARGEISREEFQQLRKDLNQ